MNPRNVELSAARREALLAGFDSLHEDSRADLLEAAETLAGMALPGDEAAEIRAILAQAYRAAGLS
jgi:hypothetical protein